LERTVVSQLRPTIEGDAEPVTHYSNGQVKEYRLRNGKESYVCIAEATEAIGGAQ
jgi:hypothetical protein